MPNRFFTAGWLNKFSDPYALLGISVSADDRRIAKRYRDIAKQLHPDLFPRDQIEAKQFATHALSKVVNPTYQRLKQDKGRAESLAVLRFTVRRLTRDQQLQPRTPLAIKLLNTPQAEAEVFYEQAVSQLAADQYASFEALEAATKALMELNLVFLRVKMGDPIIRSKRTGIMTRPQTPPVSTTPVGDRPQTSSGTTNGTTATGNASPTTNATGDAAKAEINYAQRHYDRAVAYAKAGNWTLTIAELKDAIRIAPKHSAYHALIGTAYFHQKLMGMAKVHIRQALKLNPQEQLALKYAPKLAIDVAEFAPPSSPEKNKSKGGLLGGLFARR